MARRVVNVADTIEWRDITPADIDDLRAVIGDLRFALFVMNEKSGAAPAERDDLIDQVERGRNLLAEVSYALSPVDGQPPPDLDALALRIHEHMWPTTQAGPDF